jgi:hypothetical protein
MFMPNIFNDINIYKLNVYAEHMAINTLVPEVYFSSALRNENNKNKPLEPG